MLAGSTRASAKGAARPYTRVITASGQKAPDSDAIPLCSVCHRTGQQAYHRLGKAAFERAHGLHAGGGAAAGGVAGASDVIKTEENIPLTMKLFETSAGESVVTYRTREVT